MPVLKFKGKSNVYSHHLGVSFRSLEVDEKKSLLKKSKSRKKDKPSLDDNLIIHGDNLHALKALLPRYAGKVKCIYIDPPYNTGNEDWKYNDNVNSPSIKEWLGKVVGVDDLERHDKWLCMMWPRLHLLKELLSDEGVIFISIDDNEIYHLSLMMKEIFGTDNLISTVIPILNPRGRTFDNFFAKTHEYILVVAKDASNSKSINLLPKSGKKLKEYNKTDTQGNKYRILELRNRNPVFNRKNRPNLFFPIFANPKNGSVSLSKSKIFSQEILPRNQKGEDDCWTWSKQKVDANIESLLAKQASTKAWRVFRKDYLYAENGDISRTKENTLWNEKEINNENGKEVLRELFQGKCPLDFPKSVDLIKKCIKLGANKNSIILDSFAGSGTTAHAVLDLNKEDGGNRKFILVECEDYADKITAERVRRVIKGVPKAKEEKLKKGLSGSFTYCTLGKEINEENLIKGKSLPSYNTLSSYVYYVATGQTLDKVNENENFYIGKSDKDTAFFVIYKPSIKFLRSKESALNLDRKEKIQKIMKQKKCKKAVVFAPVHYFDSAGELAKEGVIFCQLPFSIYKIAGA